MLRRFLDPAPLSDVVLTGRASTYHYFRSKRPETKADQIDICLALVHSNRHFCLQYSIKPQKMNLQGSLAEPYEQMQGENS